MTSYKYSIYFTGVNVPDHAAMFANLKKMIRSDITRHVVSLHSSSCQNIKSTIASTVAQLMPNSGIQVVILDARDTVCEGQVVVLF
jgi:hypothetical protein